MSELITLRGFVGKDPESRLFEDGTMVVVEEGLKFRGKPTRVLVVNNVQTNVGRMIFAKLDREENQP